jgi:hypothetical protein
MESQYFLCRMDREWMYLSRMDKQYMLGVGKFLADAKAVAGDGNPIFWPCKDCKNQRKWARIESI